MARRIARAMGVGQEELAPPADEADELGFYAPDQQQRGGSGGGGGKKGTSLGNGDGSSHSKQVYGHEEGEGEGGEEVGGAPQEQQWRIQKGGSSSVRGAGRHDVGGDVGRGGGTNGLDDDGDNDAGSEMAVGIGRTRCRAPGGNASVARNGSSKSSHKISRNAAEHAADEHDDGDFGSHHDAEVTMGGRSRIASGAVNAAWSGSAGARASSGGGSSKAAGVAPRQGALALAQEEDLEEEEGCAMGTGRGAGRVGGDDGGSGTTNSNRHRRAGNSLAAKVLDEDSQCFEPQEEVEVYGAREHGPTKSQPVSARRQGSSAADRGRVGGSRIKGGSAVGFQYDADAERGRDGLESQEVPRLKGRGGGVPGTQRPADPVAAELVAADGGGGRQRGGGAKSNRPAPRPARAYDDDDDEDVL
jgi:hypothetical protein